jgi:hypothetical protein
MEGKVKVISLAMWFLFPFMFWGRSERVTPHITLHHQGARWLSNTCAVILKYRKFQLSTIEKALGFVLGVSRVK